MRISQREATAKMVDAADQASKAVVHIDQCSSVLKSVFNAQTQTQTSLDTVSKRIAWAQQEIKENEQRSSDMAAKARRHDERAEANDKVYSVAG
jgi:prefoldin subunit 5